MTAAKRKYRTSPNLACPKCGEKLFVRDSRVNTSDNIVRRRRACYAGHLFSTIEVLVEDTALATQGSSVITAMAKKQLIAMLRRIAGRLEIGEGPGV